MKLIGINYLQIQMQFIYLKTDLCGVEVLQELLQDLLVLRG